MHRIPCDSTSLIFKLEKDLRALYCKPAPCISIYADVNFILSTLIQTLNFNPRQLQSTIDSSTSLTRLKKKKKKKTEKLKKESFGRTKKKFYKCGTEHFIYSDLNELSNEYIQMKVRVLRFLQFNASEKRKGNRRRRKNLEKREPRKKKVVPRVSPYRLEKFPFLTRRDQIHG